MINYTDDQLAALIDLYYRNHRRPAPWPVIAKAMGVPNPEALDDLLWKLITGYPGRDPDGPRRVFKRAPRRAAYRAGAQWHPREDDALRAALAGEGQRRDPPCDIDYIATVLARTACGVEDRWERINRDPLGRKGFFGE